MFSSIPGVGLDYSLCPRLACSDARATATYYGTDLNRRLVKLEVLWTQILDLLERNR